MNASHHFGDVEFGHVLRKAVFVFGEEREKIAAAVIIHHEVQIVRVLEGKVKLRDPFLVSVHENVSLLKIKAAL